MLATFFFVALQTFSAVALQHLPTTLTVEQVHARAPELDGQAIYVRGIMGECRHLSCHLYSADNPERRSRGNMLSFASGAFDERLAQVEGEEIILRARFEADCLTDLVCTDRAPMLHPMQIVQIVDRPNHSNTAE